MKTKKIILQVVVATMLAVLACISMKVDRHSPEKAIYLFGHFAGRTIERVVVQHFVTNQATNVLK